jgi:adenylate kinase family enzyme
VRRVAVIGCPGAGKSTFALRLGAILGIEVIHLDRLYWRPGWVRTPTDEWLQKQRAALRGDAWIVDGNYSASLELRLAAADVVVFLDYPPAICLWRALWRVVRSRWVPRPDMAAGCRERVDRAFVRFIWTFRDEKRPGIMRRLEAAPPGTRVVHLRSDHEADAFLEEMRAAAAARRQ